VPGWLSWVLLYLGIGVAVALAGALFDRMEHSDWRSRKRKPRLWDSPRLRFLFRMLVWPVPVILATMSASFF